MVVTLGYMQTPGNNYTESFYTVAIVTALQTKIAITLYFYGEIGYVR